MRQTDRKMKSLGQGYGDLKLTAEESNEAKINTLI